MNYYLVIVLSVIAFDCTVAAIPLDWETLGGRKAYDGQFPYHISLRYNGVHFCSGSILNKRWILTAAHCVDGYNSSDLEVVAGSNQLDGVGSFYAVDSTEYHNGWNSWELVNAIGLIKLTQEIEFNENIQPIEINTDDIGKEEELILSGWGSNSFPGETSNDLQWIKLISISSEECQFIHSDNIYDTEICTFTESGESACYGDFGSPIVFKGKVAGIISWERMCVIGYPDVFTKVSSDIEWITEMINK